MIVDAFCFFNEIELTEIRLNSLAPYVDEFIIVEASRTHKGEPKPYYFHDNKARFAGFPITCVELPLKSNDELPNVADPVWYRERTQRMAISYAIDQLNLSSTDMILISDLDEIPDLSTWDGREGYFAQKLYYYYLNGYHSDNWHGTMAITKASFDVLGAQGARELRWSFPEANWYIPQVGGGWHYSYLGGVEAVKAKIQAFAHQELNTQENIDQLAARFASLQDPYGRTEGITIVDLDGPEWLLANRAKYPHLIKEKA